MKFANAYSKTDDVPGLECKDDSRAVQSQADDADINTIVKRYKLTGELPNVRPRIPLSADFRDAGEFDLGSALRYVREAERAFMMYPAEVRAKFKNDPAQFCHFVENPDNEDEAIALGILPKKPMPRDPEIMNVRVIDPEKK